jgi:hypothetical protein
MKIGKTLQELAAELERQAATKRDYIAPQGKIEAKVVEGEIVLDGLNGEAVGITDHAHAQFADHLKIPRAYYERMRTAQPALLTDNLNTWLHANADERRMVRTLDGRARGFLSPKYRPLDNHDLAHAVLPVLLKNNVQIMSAELTERRMYIKAILPSLSDELPTGMQWGVGHNNVATGGATGERMFGRTGRLVAAIVIRNSEVGDGSLAVEPSVFTTWCTNLAIMQEAAMRKYHVGRASEVADGSFEVFRDATRAADDRAFFMKVQDVTMAAFAEDKFRAAVAQIRDAAKREIKSDDLPKVVEVVTKRLALPEATGNSILKHLAAGGDLTQWGLSSAITSTANDFGDYEGATELERAGGAVLALTDKEWAPIAEAA